MKPVLGIDFDDVLFPFMARLVPHYNERYAANFQMDDYHTFEFHEVWGGTPEDAWFRVADFFDQPHTGIAPLDGAVDGIDALHEQYELAIITARDESLRVHTEAWLDERFPGRFRHVHLCNSYSLDPDAPRRTKLDVLNELDAVGIIDDSLRTTSQVAESGRKALLFGDYAWNRSEDLPHGVKRFVDWQSIVESLVIAA